MRDLQKEYFEAESFWSNGMLQDEFNRERIVTTLNLVPADVHSLLDAGCGNGVFLNALKRSRGATMRLVGTDRSKTALEFVETEKVQSDIISLPFDDNAFDCVSSLEVLEHLPIEDYKMALHELARVSRRYILVSVPFEEKLEQNFTTCPSCKTAFNRDLHLRSFSEAFFRNMFSEHGFTSIHIKKAGRIQTYVGQHTYHRLINGDTRTKWDSPICPVCGYRSPATNGGKQDNQVRRRPLKSVISAIPKVFWPKQVSYYWIIGLFQKKREY